MKTGTCVLLTISVLLLLLVSGMIAPQGEVGSEEKVVEEASRDVYIPSEVDLKVPYHTQENSQSTGMAALECVFDYYGPRVSQAEIRDVIGPYFGVGEPDEEEIVRGGHFSNNSAAVSTSPLSTA